MTQYFIYKTSFLLTLYDGSLIYRVSDDVNLWYKNRARRLRLKEYFKIQIMDIFYKY